MLGAEEGAYIHEGFIDVKGGCQEFSIQDSEGTSSES
jgi:hypothetical protein